MVCLLIEHPNRVQPSAGGDVRSPGAIHTEMKEDEQLVSDAVSFYLQNYFDPADVHLLGLHEGCAGWTMLSQDLPTAPSSKARQLYLSCFP